ncbi:sensor domain-containing diguanylate cyclase [Hydrogenothermus marinus]|uniref:diguanylate cyclase n=1 Tax=Hydrogenothermus marinus TaxID=133270 RepID=A0A3M0BLW4_9AQUI|nr:sensor domain-containing diguanylate cyclase [Hydrogenothermus marinus]RMA97269.1 diguanylate cyclase (GGDEF)-like protein [Hydrogenothermus marinus]
MKNPKLILEIVQDILNKEYEKDNWKSILDKIADFFDSEFAAIGKIKGNFLYYDKFSSNFYKIMKDYDPKKYKVPIKNSLWKDLAKKGTYLIINDYQNHEKAIEKWKKLGIKTLLVAVIGKDTPIGSLAVANVYKDKKFTEEEGEVLRDLGYIISSIISEEIEREICFERAIKDSLTGLYNRFFLEMEANKEFERAKRYKFPISIIMIDIDNFKNVNDTYGHLVGDEVLKKIANIIKNNIRKTDIAARYGGEEFVILLPNTPLEKAIKVAERIRQKVEEELFKDENNTFKVTISAGVSYCDYENCDFKKVLEEADKALYIAKAQGKNKVVVHN